MEEQIKRMIADTRRRVAEEVPDEGEFMTLHVGFKNPDSELVLDEIWLEVMVPPQDIKDRLTLRGLKIVASKLKSGVEAEVLLASQPRQGIIAKLDDPGLSRRLLDSIRHLSNSLEDIWYEAPMNFKIQRAQREDSHPVC